MNKLKGTGLNYHFELYKAHDEACNQAIINNPNLVKFYDIETGFPFPVTKEYVEKFKQIWEATKPKNFESIKGQILFFGTGGNLDNNDFEEIFKNP